MLPGNKRGEMYDFTQPNHAKLDIFSRTSHEPIMIKYSVIYYIINSTALDQAAPLLLFTSQESMR